MPATICSKIKFIFGIPEVLPPIRDGWKYDAATDGFLRGISPDGTIYLLSENGDAYPVIDILEYSTQVNEKKMIPFQ